MRTCSTMPCPFDKPAPLATSREGGIFVALVAALTLLCAGAQAQSVRAPQEDTRGSAAGAGATVAPDDLSLLRRRFNVMNDRDLRAKPTVESGDGPADGDEAAADEPLYEGFSRYIRDTTGKNVADAMPIKRSLAKAPKLPDSYVVGRGDQIEIQVWGSVNSQYMLTVDDSGRIFVPEVGSVLVLGVKAGELSKMLTSAFQRIYRGFDLRAVVGAARGVAITVSGQAASIGVKNVPASHSLVSAALSFARPAPGGSRRFIGFKRGTGPVQRIDLYCFLRSDCQALPEALADGDALQVPLRGKLVAVSGGVARPGIYELASGETLNDLLVYAGGLSVIADPGRVYAYRFEGHNTSRRAIRTAGLDTLCPKVLGDSTARTCLEPVDGDVFDIQQRLPAVQGFVTVAAQGADPIKIEYRNGMRLLDVLRAPFDKLVPPRALRAMNNPTFAALSELDDKLRRLDLDALTLYRLDLDRREYVPSSLSYRAALAAEEGDANALLKDGDVLVVEDQTEWMMRRDEQQMSVRVLGEVGRPGRYRFVGNKTLGEVLRMAGGASPNAALWSAVVLRQGDGRSAVQREMMERALKAITEQQQRQELVNSDRPATAMQPRADGMGSGAGVGTVQTLSSRVRAEVQELMKGRDVIYLAAKGSAEADSLVLAPQDVIIVPPQQDTFGCQGAFFRPGEFLATGQGLSTSDASGRCGVIEELNPTIYHFVSRENRVCRSGWLRSCPTVAGGDTLVAVPEVVTRRGMAAVMDWLDLTFKSLASLATLKVLSN